jgi:tRNA(Ile)-lysidine synthase
LVDVAARLVGPVRVCLGSLPDIERGLVVAVSGGPDSVALLRAVVAARAAAGWPVVLAHLNHQLRGAESDADEAFVADLRTRLGGDGAGLRIRSQRIDVAAQARADGTNLEETARRARYRWLAELAREQGIGWVATGHTADDQAETVLHRLLRGTGLQGLRGIAARRELEPDIGLVRPLLSVTRADVLAYMSHLAQPYRTDSSNEDLALTRNRIRRDLLPQLAERFNPAIVVVLCRLADQADELFREEDAAAAALLARAERPRAGAMLVLDRQALAGAPRRLVRSALRHLWQREGWPTGSMGFEAWERLAEVAIGERTAVDLPAGVTARCRERVVQLERDAGSPAA